MYCENCGTKLGENATFCKKCGSNTGNEMTKRLDKGRNKTERKPKKQESDTQIEEGIVSQENNSFKLTAHDKYSGADMDYFAVPTWRLVAFSILSLGIYQIYWFYKNWEEFRNKANPAISPFWRSLMPQFFCHGLFAQILYSARLRGYRTNYYPWLLYFIYIFMMIINRAENQDPSLSLICFAIYLFSFIPLLIVQQAIVYNNQALGLEKTKKINISEIIITIAGFTIFAFYGYIGYSEGVKNLDTNIMAPITQETTTVLGENILEKALIETSNEINKDLPTMLDEITQLTTTTTSGKELIYVYKIIKPNTQFTQYDLDQSLKSNIVNGVCTNPDTKKLIDMGAGLGYSYYDNDGKYIGKISVNLSDCK